MVQPVGHSAERIKVMSTKKVNSEKSMETQGIVFIELSKIAVSGFNPRRTISESELQERLEALKNAQATQEQEIIKVA
jgi:Icc-related predicted phosphoesterase